MLPGYNGYLESENRRHEDRKARDYLSERLQDCKRDLQIYLKSRLAAGDFDVVLAGEKLREQINHVQAKTLAALEGYSAKFDARKIDTDELQKLVDIDSDLVSVVDRLQQEILRRDTPHQEAIESGKSLNFEQANEWITMYRNRFDKRSQLLAK